MLRMRVSSKYLFKYLYRVVLHAIMSYSPRLTTMVLKYLSKYTIDKD